MQLSGYLAVAWPWNLTEDIIEVWGEYMIRSSILAEFGGKGNAKKIDPSLLVKTTGDEGSTVGRR